MTQIEFLIIMDTDPNTIQDTTETDTDIVSRLKIRLRRADGLSQLDKIVEQHSYLNGVPYDFNDHEWQREVIRDNASRLYIRKCSQVGASEAMIAKTLALCVALGYSRIIYTLPTDIMAGKFSKDRFDNAINQSPYYSDLVRVASNSAGMKQIGTSVLYISGAHSDTAAISIPATVLINDELDFSSPAVVEKQSSRLRHANVVDAQGRRGIRYGFSTPTVDGFGVDVGYMSGSQKHYAVKCEHCDKWQIVDFVRDFKLPGFDRSNLEMSQETVAGLDFSQAVILCPHCKADLQSSLCNASRRQWVAKHPSRDISSYQISPWDLPTYNTPPVIVEQAMDYALNSDFLNFVVGLPFTDKENTFTTDDVFRQVVSKVPDTLPGSITEEPVVIGMDVGKICHMVILGARSLRVFAALKIVNHPDDPAGKKVLGMYDKWHCSNMVIDAGPDISLVNELTVTNREISACVYVRSLPGTQVYAPKPKEHTINVDRTKSMTLLLHKHNEGRIAYPQDRTTTKMMFDHMAVVKKIRRTNADGTVSEAFQSSSSEDHFLHALHYAMIAAMSKYGVWATTTIQAPVSVGVTRLRQESDVRNDLLSQLGTKVLTRRVRDSIL